MKNLRQIALAGAAAFGAAAITLGTAGIAGAQDTEPADPAPAEETDRAERRAEKRQAIADAIGITVTELTEARESGETLAEIAGDELPAVVDVLIERATARVEAKVESGRITQEQADARLEGLDERIEDRLENGREGRKRGKRGDRANAQSEELTLS